MEDRAVALRIIEFLNKLETTNMNAPNICITAYVADGENRNAVYTDDGSITVVFTIGELRYHFNIEHDMFKLLDLGYDIMIANGICYDMFKTFIGMTRDDTTIMYW